MKKIILALIVLLNFAQLASASTSAAFLPNQKISIEAKSAGARDIIKNLLDQSNLKYDLPTSLTNAKKVSIDAKSAAWSDVFKMAVADAGFQYKFDSNGVLHLAPIATTN